MNDYTAASILKKQGEIEHRSSAKVICTTNGELFETKGKTYFAVYQGNIIVLGEGIEPHVIKDNVAYRLNELPNE